MFDVPEPRRWEVPAVLRWVATPAGAMFCLAVVVLGTNLDQGDVRVDGPLYAWVSRHMVLSGDWLNLFLDHGQTPYFNKPPLQFWMTAVAIQLLGPTTLAAKLPSVLFGLGCVAMTWRLARRRLDEATAATAGIVLVTSYTFFRNTSAMRLDAGVTFFFLVTLEMGLRILENPAARWRDWLGLGLVLGLGFMEKGGAVCLALPVWWATAIWDRKGRRLLDSRWLAALALAAVIVLPWYVQQHLTWGPQFLEKHFGREQLGRFASGTFGENPWYFWGQQLLYFYWPWLPLAVWGGWRALRAPGATRQTMDRFWLAWLGVTLGLLHCIPRKHDRYLLFVLPVLAVLAAEAWMSSARLSRIWRAWVLPHLGYAALVGMLGLQGLRVPLSRVQLPELAAVAPLIRQPVHGQGSARAPVVYTVGEINLQHLCSIRYYTAARVIPLERPDHPPVLPGDFLVWSRAGAPEPTDLPPHRRLVAGRLLEFQWVVGP